jgi:F-type H+-transporting ATPase subunit delta
MAELATIARPYAEALFKATSKDLNGAAVWVDALSAVAQNAQLQQKTFCALSLKMAV